MGGAMVVPDNDERMDRLAHLFHLTDFDIGKFYRLFNKLGKLHDFPPRLVVWM